MRTAFNDANLIIWLGPEMTPWLERTLDGLETEAAQIELLDAPGTETRSYDDESLQGHDAGATGGDAHDHEGHDPHAWLDPRNATTWLDLIAAKLGELDPDHAAAYADNAAAGATLIMATEAEINALLDPVKAKPFVVYHDAYGYFAAHFGLTVAGEIAIGDATSPSAAKLANLRATLIAGSAACIFPEANHDPKLLTQITEGTPTSIGGVLDPEGANLLPGPTLYPDLMRALATTLADCLAKS
jgi:zinc transport system substrate-binding protein